ncbi:hypothetical protein HNQ92_004163 [Rhabdobacter roseus]|uniref:Uncharacterized protein n=1 Tax=Rhabdobacter roseus TaxID=1655419 RepID=A0A840TXJ9_9BACT|nr:hypothetical protein [Rhabdobacter roseus]
MAKKINGICYFKKVPAGFGRDQPGGDVGASQKYVILAYPKADAGRLPADEQ